VNTIEAAARCEAAMARKAPLMVFDWDKAARIIRDRGAKRAAAGLSCDWEWTGGDILVDGEPTSESYTYLASLHAEPELEVDGGELVPCWRLQADSHGWDSGTKWPESALAILKGDAR
jgi:hypothetical protein